MGPVLTLLFLSFLGTTIYSLSLEGEFLWDDHFFVKGNSLIRDFFRFPQLFVQDVPDRSYIDNYTYYRPLQELTYMLDYRLWGLNVVGYHLTNIFLHVAVAGAVFWFVQVIGAGLMVAALTSVLFICHPVHSESVCYISGRGDLLASLFLVSSFTYYVKMVNAPVLLYGKFMRQGPLGSTPVLVALTFFLALLSKENALILPVLTGAYHYVYRKKISGQNVLPLIISLFCYVVMRFINKGTGDILWESLRGAQTRLPGFFQSILVYFRLLVFPINLHFDYGQRLFAWHDAGVVTGFGVLVGLLFLGVTQVRRYPLLSFSVFWFLITLLPYANVYRVYSYLAEHNLYIPSIAFFLVIADMICRGMKHGRFPPVVSRFLFTGAALWIIWCSSLTIQQSLYWRDPIEFYQRTLKFVQRDTLYLNLGVEYQQRGDLARAMAAYRKSLELNAWSAVTYRNLAFAYFQEGNGESAAVNLEKALACDPKDSKSFDLLGVVYSQEGKWDLADKAFARAIHLNPQCPKPYIHWGDSFHRRGAPEEAVFYYRKALQCERDDEAQRKLSALLYPQN